MIKEIVNFTTYLEENNPEIFSKNLELKEGLYVFLNVIEEDGGCIIKNIDSEGNINAEDIKVYEKNSEWGPFFDKCKKLQFHSKVFPAEKNNKALDRKIFAYTASPYAIAFQKNKYISLAKDVINNKLQSYFKYANKYNLDKWQINNKSVFSIYLTKNFFSLIENNLEYKKLKKDQFVYIFHKNPNYEDYEKTNKRYIEEKIFNKGLTDKSNLKIQDIYYGPPDNLISLEDKKQFKQHQTGIQKYTYRIESQNAIKIYNFFHLQRNKQLPCPMPVFIDREELTRKVISLYGIEGKKKYSEIIKELVENQKENLQNYYLIFFNNSLKKSRITDLDFVPVFKYYFDATITIDPVFNFYNKKSQTYVISRETIKNVFEFEYLLNNNIFLQYSNNSNKSYGILKDNYFSSKINPSKGYTISETTLNLIYKYRKSIYDYIYKSRRQAITNIMFHDIMKNCILNDIRHDEYKNEKHTREYQIKIKLNIWFNLYNFFSNSQNLNNMANKTKELFEKIIQIAKKENERMQYDNEFAFASGQLIRLILNKSQAGDRKHSLLEPFLQKTNPEQFKLAIAKAFETYKHEFVFYKGNKRYEFDKIMSEVMGFEPEEGNMKKHLPFILAGYFSETIFKKETEENKEEV